MAPSCSRSGRFGPRDVPNYCHTPVALLLAESLATKSGELLCCSQIRPLWIFIHPSGVLSIRFRR